MAAAQAPWLVLTSLEHAELLEIVPQAQVEFLDEIRWATTYVYRDRLIARETWLRALSAKLSAATASVTT